MVKEIIGDHGNGNIFFFLNQQFITRSARADHSSYFITTYIQTDIIWREKQKNNKKTEKEKKET